MPKKLAQLRQDVDAVVASYEDHMSQLRAALTTASNHRSMVEEGEGELLHRLQELEKKGKKGATVGDFYDDREAKVFIDEIENQKARFINACGQYWKIRPELDKDLKSAQGVVASAKEIAADKKRQWFGSSSLPSIKAVTNDLETWCADMKHAQSTMDKLPKPGTSKLAWMAPGSTKKAKRSDVMDKQNLHDLKELLQFVQQRAVADPKRAKLHKQIHDRLAEVAKQNPD